MPERIGSRTCLVSSRHMLTHERSLHRTRTLLTGSSKMKSITSVSPDWLALINMASDLERTKIILSELKGISPSGIWAEMEARRLVA